MKSQKPIFAAGGRHIYLWPEATRLSKSHVPAKIGTMVTIIITCPSAVTRTQYTLLYYAYDTVNYATDGIYKTKSAISIYLYYVNVLGCSMRPEICMNCPLQLLVIKASSFCQPGKTFRVPNSDNMPCRAMQMPCCALPWSR